MPEMGQWLVSAQGRDPAADRAGVRLRHTRNAEGIFQELLRAAEEKRKMTFGYDLEQFVAKVSEMRNAQKTYFRTRPQEFLNRSKSLEREIDKAIADFYEEGV